jgi:uncharacterized membrane protein
MSSEAELHAAVSTTESGNHSDLVQAAVRFRESIYLPSSELKGYNDVLPGAADRLLTLFEEQARHRMTMEACQIQNELESTKMALEADQANRTQAAGLGVFALMSFVVLAAFFAIMGLEGAAIVAILVPAVQCIGDWIGKLTRDRRSTDVVQNNPAQN